MGSEQEFAGQYSSYTSSEDSSYDQEGFIDSESDYPFNDRN